MKNTLIAFLILTPLLLTALFYVWFREGTVFYQAIGMSNYQLHFFDNNVVNSIPSFAHVYAFSLMSWWASGKKNGLFSILLWVMINIIFELAQLLNHEQVGYLPPLIADYFSKGHFSIFDIAATALGGLAAYFTLLKFNEN